MYHSFLIHSYADGFGILELSFWWFQCSTCAVHGLSLVLRPYNFLKFHKLCQCSLADSCYCTNTTSVQDIILSQRDGCSRLIADFNLLCKTQQSFLSSKCQFCTSLHFITNYVSIMSTHFLQLSSLHLDPLWLCQPFSLLLGFFLFLGNTSQDIQLAYFLISLQCLLKYHPFSFHFQDSFIEDGKFPTKTPYLFCFYNSYNFWYNAIFVAFPECSVILNFEIRWLQRYVSVHFWLCSYHQWHTYC